MRFILIDEFTGDHREMHGADAREVAEARAAELGLSHCLSPVLVEDNDNRKPITGARRFVDEATKEGWGAGCKFAGQNPKNQVLLLVCPA